MFELIARERAWMFNPGGQIIWDERQTGAAAGGRRAGQAVFALVQVTDQNDQSIELARGEFIERGDHAEERAINALKRHLPPDLSLSGGLMTVLVDQVPCCVHRHNCRGKLQEFADRKGLRLEVWVPTRPSIRGTSWVRPKTAMKSSMRATVPGWSLVQYQAIGDHPCCEEDLPK